jgi:RimJ/RimL family protein N-acetyltransferase
MANATVVPVLKDDRLVLRGWRPDDVAALEPACGDPQICRITTVPDRFTIEDALDWIARQREYARRGSGVVLAIVPVPGDRPVGMVGLFGLDDPGSTAEFGYWLVARWRGQGLASAAVGLLADWGFTRRTSPRSTSTANPQIATRSASLRSLELLLPDPVLCRTTALSLNSCATRSVHRARSGSTESGFVGFLLFVSQLVLTP